MKNEGQEDRLKEISRGRYVEHVETRPCLNPAYAIRPQDSEFFDSLSKEIINLIGYASTTMEEE